MNQHAVADTAFLRSGKEVFEFTPKVKAYPFENSDMVLSVGIDGPFRLKKNHCDIAAEGQTTVVVTPTTVTTGTVLALETGPYGPQMRVSISSEPGDCGAPYLNANGKVIGIHFAEGRKGANNMGIPFTAKTLAMWDPMPKN